MIIAVAILIALAIVAFDRWRVRRALRGLADAVRDIVRDPQLRLRAHDAEPGGVERELARWIDALAEQAADARAAHGHQRVLLSSVVDGLNQGVIAVNAKHEIELLNDAARRMLGVSSPLVGVPLLEFVRVPE